MDFSFLIIKKLKKIRHETKSSGVIVVLYTLWRFLHGIYYSTHMENVIYLFYTIKIQFVYWRIFGAWKKNQQVCSRGFDAICVSVL